MHLIIAEKNIAARRISSILSENGRVATDRDGGVNTYRFNDCVAMGLRGHVVEVDFEPGYTNWRSEVHTPRTLIDARTIKKPTEKRIVNLIKKLAKKAVLVTIATDFDTEGELIGKEAYELVREVNPGVPITRARFSAITPAEITQAFSHTTDLDFHLAAAGESRQEIDLMWGASLTRFISLAARRGGANILSVGRVQSPTLAMIVDREKEIEAFVAEPYWLLSLATEKAGQELVARHTHGKFWEKAEAEAALGRTKSPLIVTDVRVGSKKDRPPHPLDTTSFIVAASRLRFSAANAMRIAEDLYMNGYISYPRTDNTVYPVSLDLKEIVKALVSSPFGADAKWVLEHMRPTPTRGMKSSTDHPPIHPTAAVRREQLTEEQWTIYEMVVRRFLATLSPDARWKTMKYLFSAGGEEYTATGSRLEEEGYRHVYPYSEAKEIVLPELERGEQLPVRDILMEEKETQPPSRYSQSKLIQRMEELGLGTKSTRHEVIGKLVSRRYVQGTPLRPTLVGRAVTETLENHAELITKPDMTQTLESHMQDIKTGKRTKGDVVTESRYMLHQVFDELEAHETEIGEEIMEQTDEERILGPCPVCRRDLMIRSTRGMKQFIGCTGYPDCTFNIGLPGAQWGKAIRIEAVCPVHHLHHVRLIRKGARPWDLGCPLCSHIESNVETLLLMPSMDGELMENLHGHHLYTVYDIATSDPERLSALLHITKQYADTIIAEAEAVLDILRKRSELRKFVRKHLPPRKGRSHARIVQQLIDAGINDIGDLAAMESAVLKPMKVGEKEADALIGAAREIRDTQLLKGYGVSAVSMKKYREAGFTRPEDLCYLHPAYLSLKTGIAIETVYKHVEKVCGGMGVSPPGRVTKRALEQGKEELLAIPGIGEAILERLFRAGIVDGEGLRAADAAQLARISGISEEKIRAFKAIAGERGS
jgi:DNA topoisomerase-1